MTIQIQSIHFTAANNLKKFIKFKLTKLQNLHHSISEADVFLKIDKPESFSNKVVEIRLISSASIFFAKKKSNSFENSMSLVFQALRKQILKNKKK